MSPIVNEKSANISDAAAALGKGDEHPPSPAGPIELDSQGRPPLRLGTREETSALLALYFSMCKYCRLLPGWCMELDLTKMRRPTQFWPGGM
jgi:hypothetical protein